jgi:hypothetical protein
MFRRRAPNPDLSGHPFRRTLPAHVLRPLPVLEPEVEAATKALQVPEGLRSPPVDPKHVTVQDVKDFLLAYCACFLAISVFIF